MHHLITLLAGIKLDREVNVVAFTNGTSMELPPGSEYKDPYTGKLRGPDELIEGLNSDPYGDSFYERNPLKRLLGRKPRQPYVDRPQVGVLLTLLQTAAHTCTKLHTFLNSCTRFPQLYFRVLPVPCR